MSVITRKRCTRSALVIGVLSALLVHNANVPREDWVAIGADLVRMLHDPLWMLAEAGGIVIGYLIVIMPFYLLWRSTRPRSLPLTIELLGDGTWRDSGSHTGSDLHESVKALPDPGRQ